jgi:hypothetical protein
MSLSGKTGYVHNKLIVAYSIRDGHYHLVQNGKSVFKNKSVGECLEVSSEMILDAYADAIEPSWEAIESFDVDFSELDEQEPITERYPHNYAPDWAEAAA